MYDFELVLSILKQIDTAIDTIKIRTINIKSVDDFTTTAQGIEKLDAVCMLFLSIGESLKNLDKITNKSLLSKYQDIDWTGVIGFRDIIAHHYFDIDADQIFWILENDLENLSQTIKKIISDFLDEIK